MHWLKIRRSELDTHGGILHSERVSAFPIIVVLIASKCLPEPIVRLVLRISPVASAVDELPWGLRLSDFYGMIYAVLRDIAIHVEGADGVVCSITDHQARLQTRLSLHEPEDSMDYVHVQLDTLNTQTQIARPSSSLKIPVAVVHIVSRYLPNRLIQVWPENDMSESASARINVREVGLLMSDLLRVLTAYEQGHSSNNLLLEAEFPEKGDQVTRLRCTIETGEIL